MTEAQLQRKIQNEVRDRGGKVLKLHGSAFSVAGTPDLIGCLCGVSFAVEVKLPGNQPTTRQRVELEEWAEQGWAVGVVHSVDEALDIILGGKR